MNEDNTELRNIIEAALLATEEPLTFARISSLFPEDAAPSVNLMKQVIQQLQNDYDGRGVELQKVGKGYRFQSKEKYSPWLRKLNEGRPARYSRAALETLAIIAYRQPVTRGDIEEIRGVTVSTDIMRLLLDRGWVKQVGQRDVPGRPSLFGTTTEFLAYFNLPSLSDLPPLLERREATEIAKELNLRLPLEEQMRMEDSNVGESELQVSDELGFSAEPQKAKVISIEDVLSSKDEQGETA